MMRKVILEVGEVGENLVILDDVWELCNSRRSWLRMNNSQKKFIRDLHSNSRELHDSRREKAQFSLPQLYLLPCPADFHLRLAPRIFILALSRLVRFPDPLGKWVGRTNPLRAGNFTSEASSTENVACTPPHIIHNWILRHVNKAWTLSKLGQVTLGSS